MHKLIEDSTPGGLHGWMEAQLSTNPTVIVFGPTDPVEFSDFVQEYLETHGYQSKKVGKWRVYAPVEP